MPTWSNGYDISLSLEGNQGFLSHTFLFVVKGDFQLPPTKSQEERIINMALFKQNGYNPGSTPGVGVFIYQKI